MSGVDPARFRELCGRFVTGVTVATSLDQHGRPVGMTVNSFTSVSLAPPLVSLSVDESAELSGLLTTTPRFALNVLRHDQEGLSRRFAEPHPDRFADIGFAISPLGNPVLDGVLAVIECESHARFQAGDHTIVIGMVVDGQAHAGRPLVYFRGGYRDTELR